MDSPGGYQLVGRTLPIWNKFVRNPVFTANEPWLLRFFDQVQFHPVEEQELATLREAFREGRATIPIEHERFDFAAYRRFLADHAASIDAFKRGQKAAFDEEVARWQLDDSASNVAVSVELVAESDDALNGRRVTADMCGSVWKILVQAQQQVAAGEALVIVEAMKMELAVVAPASGRVKEVRCKVGKSVSTGDTLVVMEEAE